MPSDVGPQPRVFRTTKGEADGVRKAPYGEVGLLYSDERFEVVWVSKGDEAIDPDWFFSGAVDVLIVVQGRLRVEFESPANAPQILEPGDVLVLPPETRCRAYRWPREVTTATVFVAAYPR